MRRLLLATAWTTGFAVMGAEVAAGRLLAPAFGTSTLVWSALIGVILGGLAAGGALGGRLSARTGALRLAFLAIAASGLLLSITPALARPLMQATVARFVAGELAPLLLGLASVLAILVVPVVLLGATSPVLVHHATGALGEVGRTSGRFGAVSTTGSLAGTFACGLLLVPIAGTEAAFFVCGGLAFVVGAIGALAASTARARTAGVLLFAAACGAALAARPAESEGAKRPVVERETAYNHVRVVDEGPLRKLTLNEGYAAQTIARRDGKAYLRGVWGYYAIAPAFTKAPPSRVLVLGLGGGTSARDYAERLQGAEVVAVEIDPGVVDVARRQFGLPDAVEVHAEDARTFLARDRRAFDLVVLDAFRFPYVPFQLTTREFFASISEHLADGGALMVNVGRKGGDLDVVHAVASTLEAIFPNVAGANVPHATNSILVATRHPLSEAGGAANVSFSPTEQRELDELAPLEPWVVPDGARLVLTDDRAPVEWLTHRIVVHELARLAKRGRS